MITAESLRAKLPAVLRPFTRGVWPFVWVGVVAVGALAVFGAQTYDRAASARERAHTQERLVASMRTLIASEPNELHRAETLASWLSSGAPARVQAPSVEIGLTRLRERIQAIASSSGEGVRVLPDRGVTIQREVLVESLGEGRSVHLVRVPIEIESPTIEGVARFIEQIERVDTLWLRPGNAELQRRQGRRGDSAELRITAAWAIIEVTPEGA